MKFALIYYTTGWDVGPTIEIAQVPSPGSVIWVKQRRGVDETDMYYVDNVMYAEKGMDEGDPVYLFVRPYTGYTKWAPRTETDRVTEKLSRISEEIKTLGDKIEEMATPGSTLLGEFSHMAESVDSRQREIVDQLADILFNIEEIKQGLG